VRSMVTARYMMTLSSTFFGQATGIPSVTKQVNHVLRACNILSKAYSINTFVLLKYYLVL